ncbi:hypothetical protein GOBAR_AA23276 [Gossypium barbadense]|uniref:Glycosyltransferase N-terminal domain-containing protein n=1 Tax=Gossypium barbadense TaxID=3634 RepID=A0A2P5X235_GOSBA|nr:hypothetical protein GOBAR_AA23276 [Gossypium barbadense]
MKRQPHALVIPYPAQGHVAPLMKLALQIASHGVQVTFANTESTHAKIKASLPENVEEAHLISFVSLPDGMEPDDDRTDWVKLNDSIHRTMPGYLEDFILKVNGSNANQKFTCVVADTSVGWALELAKKAGLQAVAVWPAGGPCLALALHLPQLLEAGIIDTDQPFLWVIRSDLMNDGSLAKLPEGFINRVSNRAKFVEWAPQEKVLAHPSVACFMSHCGWNSTMEGLTMGVPFLCWPYLADQFCNRNYICDVWRIGLGLRKDENGVITRDEISSKIKTLLSSQDIKANAVHVKEVARKSLHESGGSSCRNFNNFIQHIKSI